MLFRPLFILLLALSVHLIQGPATVFPQSATVEVCGSPTLPATVESAIEGAIRSQVKGVPGTNLVFASPVCTPLAMNQTATYHVRVLATAPNFDEGAGDVAVTVKNSGEVIGPEGLLWFCNKPENLITEGPLFDGVLESGKPIRLLYHHQNRGVHPLFMRIELVNDSDKPARILIIPGDGHPNRDPVWSGIKAAHAYLPALLTGSGEIISLPPRTAEPIAFHRLVMGDTASGLATLKLVEGGAETVEVRAEAVFPFETDSAWTSAMLDPCPWHWVTPHRIFPPVGATYEITPLKYINPFVEAPIDAQIGGPEVSAKIGVEGIPKLGGGRGLNGNYAVLHTFDVTLSNPTSSAGKFEFWFDAITNYTAGIFAFPDQLVWMRPLQQHESRLAQTISLAAGEKRTFKLESMPISGGYYPSLLRIKPIAGP